VVVLATNSPTPVLDPAWLSPGTAVTTLGPKQVGRSEFDPSLAASAGLVTTDSVRQLNGYDPPFVLAGTPARDRVVRLGAVLRIAPVNLAVAQLWGQLSAATPTAAVDGPIAATAMANGWTLVTRNVRDMARTGAPIIDPFD
jgi:hypothetical protein